MIVPNKYLQSPPPWAMKSFSLENIKQWPWQMLLHIGPMGQLCILYLSWCQFSRAPFLFSDNHWICFVQLRVRVSKTFTLVLVLEFTICLAPLIVSIKQSANVEGAYDCLDMMLRSEHVATIFAILVQYSHLGITWELRVNKRKPFNLFCFLGQTTGFCYHIKVVWKVLTKMSNFTCSFPFG